VSEQALLRRLMARADLAAGEMEALVGRIVDGEVSEPEIAALLVALAMKGETVAELTGAARALRARVRGVPHSRPDCLDTCGTGGDGRGSFNVSTAAAFVVAAGGVPVAKHGNRAISSRSGSADLLAALGIAVESAPERSARLLDTIGIAFLFAPFHHPAMKAVAPVRKALGVRTLFNLIGPLTNPAGARFQLLGVFAREKVEPVARVLSALGTERALVVHGADGLDEITTTGPTLAAHVVGASVEALTIEPADLGLPPAALEQLAGGDAAENAARLEALLAGEPGPLADLVAANAGAALWIAGRAPELAAGVARARDLLASGAPRAKLEALRTAS
jgi:anthranilate phosphoribosyltransferase